MKTTSKLMPKGELGTLLGYNNEVQSYQILSNNGKIVETKSIRFLDQMKESEDSEDEDFEIIEENIQYQDINSEDEDLNQADSDHNSPPENSNPPIIEIDSDSSDDSSDSSDEDIETSLIPSSPRKLRDRTNKVLAPHNRPIFLQESHDFVRKR
jgi:hypothetical protein